VGEWTTRPPLVRRITVMRCHSGIPPNRIRISWSQILAPRDRNIALSLLSCRLVRGMVACVHVAGGEEFGDELLWLTFRSNLVRNHDFGSNSERSHNVPMAHLPPEVFQQGSDFDRSTSAHQHRRELMQPFPSPSHEAR